MYLGACIDAVSAESDTSNNCSTSVQVTVEEPELAPDLTVPSVSVSNENPRLTQAFDLRVTVMNSGDGPAPGTSITCYESNDSTINPEDDAITTASVPALPASGTASRTLATSSLSVRTYYLGACVLFVPGESDTSNNCSAGVRVVVRP